jgi:hypothetical protein
MMQAQVNLTKLQGTNDHGREPPLEGHQDGRRMESAAHTEQYYVTRQHGTERAFSNPLAGEKRDGMFRCVCCGAPIPALAGQVFGHPSIPAS